MDENDKVVKFMHPGGILHPKTVLMSEYEKNNFSSGQQNNDKVVKFMHPGGILHPKTVLMSECNGN